MATPLRSNSASSLRSQGSRALRRSETAPSLGTIQPLVPAAHTTLLSAFPTLRRSDAVERLASSPRAAGPLGGLGKPKARHRPTAAAGAATEPVAAPSRCVCVGRIAATPRSATNADTSERDPTRGADDGLLIVERTRDDANNQTQWHGRGRCARCRTSWRKIRGEIRRRAGDGRGSSREPVRRGRDALLRDARRGPHDEVRVARGGRRAAERAGDAPAREPNGLLCAPRRSLGVLLNIFATAAGDVRIHKDERCVIGKEDRRTRRGAAPPRRGPQAEGGHEGGPADAAARSDVFHDDDRPVAPEEARRARGDGARRPRRPAVPVEDREPRPERRRET